MKKKIYIFSAVAVVALVIIGTVIALSSRQSLLQQLGVANMDEKTMIETLDARLDEPSGVSASLRPDQLVLTKGSTTQTIALTSDSYYLSVAPYIQMTHECFNHNLTSCKGELTDKVMHFVVTQDDGTVLFDQSVKTMDNGFYGLWLPRNIQGTIQVTMEGYSGSIAFATTSSSATCLTSLQLSK